MTQRDLLLRRRILLSKQDVSSSGVTLAQIRTLEPLIADALDNIVCTTKNNFYFTKYSGDRAAIIFCSELTNVELTNNYGKYQLIGTPNRGWVYRATYDGSSWSTITNQYNSGTTALFYDTNREAPTSVYATYDIIDRAGIFTAPGTLCFDYAD